VKTLPTTEVWFDVHTVDSCGDVRDRISLTDEAAALSVADVLAANRCTVVVYRITRTEQQDATDKNSRYELVWYEGDCERLEVGGWIGGSHA